MLEKRSGLAAGVILAVSIAFTLNAWVSGWPEDTVSGHYYAYDDAEDGPPFAKPELDPMPQGPYSDYTIHDNPEATKLGRYHDEPKKIAMPDSFWYFGFWYEPGDELWFSPDGWLTFDDINNAFPYPPHQDPPFPLNHGPNALMAPLWQDNNPTLTEDTSSADNCQYYWHDTTDNVLWFEWYKVKGDATEETYTFLASLQLGGQKLLEEDDCGVKFSRHLIHFYYNTCSAGWDADNAATGFEDQTGDCGIHYEGEIDTEADSFHVVRMGYRNILDHDVGVTDIELPPPDEPPDIYHPGTPITVTATVENFGSHADSFPVRMVVWDVDSNVLLFENIQYVSFLDWCGNNEGNPYITYVTFPDYIYANTHHQTVTCCTELAGDECEEDDCDVVHIGTCAVTDDLIPSLALDMSVYAGEQNINFTIPFSTRVELDVFDAAGRWVDCLADGYYSSGNHTVIWDGCDAADRKVSPGIYIVRLEAGEEILVRKLVILE